MSHLTYAKHTLMQGSAFQTVKVSKSSPIFANSSISEAGRDTREISENPVPT